MLFLLNETVLDLGVAAETLERAGGPSLLQARLMHGVQSGQAALFAAGGTLQGVNENILLAIAAEIAITSEANAALFVRPDRATHPAHVAVRLASVPLVTLAAILQRQQSMGPDPAFINECVWRYASQTAAA
jgi:hypothetical protein